MAADPAILIVGAGPVGLTAALELARRGFHPRIIDRVAGPTPEFESRALGIHGRTIELLAESGVGDTLLQAGNKVTHVEIRRNGKTVCGLNLTEFNAPHPYIVSLPQGKTERILENALSDLGITVERHTECSGLDQTGSKATATLQKDGAAETVEVDFVIGADGTHSIVRKSAGISFTGSKLEPQTFGLVDAELAGPVDSGLFVVNLLNDGALIRIPIKDNLVRYISNRPDIGTAIPDAIAVSDIAWHSSFRISYRRVETFQKGPFFLMGDAAHIHSPAGGRGMNLGMEDAAWFAWAMAEGRLDSYSADRIPYAEETLKFSRTQTDRITGTTRLQATLAAAFLPLAMRIPKARQFALRGMLARDLPPPPWIGEAG